MKIVESAKVLAITSSDADQPVDKEGYYTQYPHLQFMHAYSLWLEQPKTAEPANQDKAKESADKESGKISICLVCAQKLFMYFYPPLQVWER